MLSAPSAAAAGEAYLIARLNLAFCFSSRAGMRADEGNNSRCEEKSVCIVRAESHTVLSEVDRASERHIGQSTSLTLENAR